MEEVLFKEEEVLFKEEETFYCSICGKKLELGNEVEEEICNTCLVFMLK